MTTIILLLLIYVPVWLITVNIRKEVDNDY